MDPRLIYCSDLFVLYHYTCLTLLLVRYLLLNELSALFGNSGNGEALICSNVLQYAGMIEDTVVHGYPEYFTLFPDRIPVFDAVLNSYFHQKESPLSL